MRIGVHAGTLRGFGSALVGRSVVTEMAHAIGEDELVVWAPREWALSGLGPQVRLHTTRPGLHWKFIDENVRIRAALRRERIDALFSMGDTSLPACPVPHLLMVQQAFMAYRPELWGFDTPRAFRLKIEAMAAYLRLALPSVDRVTVQTRHMRERFAERWRFPLERIDVVPSSIQPAARQVATEPEPSRSGPPYLCYVASGGPHKNHVVLAPMMARLVERFPELRCVVTTRPSDVPAMTERARELRVLDRFDFRTGLAPLPTMRLLRGATVAVIPSKLESFGIPYLEAMALGRPVVAAEGPWAREPLGDAARYASADAPMSWTDHVAELLDQTESAKGLGLAGRGRFEALDQSWSEIALAYLSTLGALAR